MEDEGNATPISGTDFYEVYGHKVGNMIAFGHFLGLMLEVMPGVNGGVKPRSFRGANVDETTTIYRVVSEAEAEDALVNGFRQAPTGTSSYEGKLF